MLVMHPAFFEMGLAQGIGNIRQQDIVRPRDRGLPRHQNIVMPGAAIKGQQGRSRRPQPPLGAVAGYGIADFPARGETYAQMADERFRRGTGFQRDSACNGANATRGAQEVGTFSQAVQGQPFFGRFG
jgi:hypothetical protein